MSALPASVNNPEPALAKALLRRPWFQALAAVAVVYALIAGLQTVSEFDLFWQLATGRWVAQHRAVFSTEVFSYTAGGQPWIYPVGSGLLFYLTYLGGGFVLLSWLGALASMGTIAIFLRRASALTAALAILAVPVIALRSVPRADIFTLVFFAVFLSVLWERYRTDGSTCSGVAFWLLPPLMALWVNLHLGFLAGVVLATLFAAALAARLLTGPRSREIEGQLKRLAAWLAGVFVATLLNPWGWGIYTAIGRQQAATATHTAYIQEWQPYALTAATVRHALVLRDPASATLWLLLVAAVSLVIALIRRQWLAALLLGGTLVMALQHIRFMAILATVAVVVGGAVLTLEWRRLRARFATQPLFLPMARAAAVALMLLASLRTVDLADNHYYLTSDQITSFGAGLSWWFPDRAMDFIAGEHLPTQVFHGYEDGGFLLWKLAPSYKDYVDGRAIPFGPDLFTNLRQLMLSSPDSPAWKEANEAYGINTIVFSLARFDGLRYVSGVLQSYCSSSTWRPVYLDEVSVVFVRRTPATEGLIERFPLDCATAPIPGPLNSRIPGAEFNRWANSAALLLALNRTEEDLAATTRALDIVPGVPALWFYRGHAEKEMGRSAAAERDLLQSAALEDRDSTWAVLADLYRSQGRVPETIHALQRMAADSQHPAGVFLLLGNTCLQARRPNDAIQAFDQLEQSLPAGTDNATLAEADNGRAVAWRMAGDLEKAAAFEEKAVTLAPEQAGYWTELGQLYEGQGRTADASRARQQAASLVPAQP